MELMNVNKSELTINGEGNYTAVIKSMCEIFMDGISEVYWRKLFFFFV